MFNRANAYAVDSPQELQGPSGLESFQTINNRPQTATGKPIRIIIVAIIIILLIIIPLIVTVAILSSRQDSSSKNDATYGTTNAIPTSVTSITTVMAVSTAGSSTMISSMTTTSAFLIPQCSQAQLINDTTRLVTAPQGSICDTAIFDSTLRWTRFIPPGGTQIPTTPTNWKQCGTFATGWINSTLPSSGMTSNATVCFTAFGNICYWNNIVQVTNCGSYFVYGFYAPPNCDARYCTV